MKWGGCTHDPSSELNGGPKTYICILTPEVVDVTLFGKSVFTDIIKGLEVILDLPGWSLNLMTGVLIRDRKEDSDRGQGHLKTGAETGVTWTPVKEAIEVGKDAPLEASEGAWPCRQLDFRLPASTTMGE